MNGQNVNANTEFPAGADIHPEEERLIAFAVDNGDPAVEAHCGKCAKCSAFVADIRRTKERIEGLEEEDIPSRLRRKILVDIRSTTFRSFPGLMFLARPFSPILIAMGIILFLIFIYGVCLVFM